MEFSSNRARAVAIELKDKFIPHYLKVAAMYAEISTWVLHCDPGRLPRPFDIRAQLEQYAELQTDALQLTDWGAELLTAEFGDTLTTLSPCATAGDTTGLFDGSATFDGSVLFDGEPHLAPEPEPEPEPGTENLVIEFLAPIANGDSQTITLDEPFSVNEMTLHWLSPNGVFDFHWDLTLNGVSLLLPNQKDKTLVYAFDPDGYTQSSTWNLFLLSQEIGAGELSLTITSTTGLLQVFRVTMTPA